MINMFENNILKEEEYKKYIHNLIDLRSSKEIGIYNQDVNSVHEFFDGHYPRFITGVNMIAKYAKFDSSSLLLENASPLPFFIGPFIESYSCAGLVKGLENFKFGVLTPNTIIEYGNICTDYIPKDAWDLIVMTEIWEHLPCSLLDVKANIIKSIKKGGYLLCSYPCQGSNSDPEKWNDVLGDYNISHSHLREFTKETAPKFITELKMLDSKVDYTAAYSGEIMTILYKKEIL